MNQEKKPTWLTKKDVGRHLLISIRTIENWVKKGRLRAYKIGGRVLFNLIEVDKAVEKCAI